MKRSLLQLALCLVLGLVCLTQMGCVRRRLTIRSNPPGAMVWVDDEPVGPTPASLSYTYYGTRKIRLVKDGYETLTVMQELPTPWYEYFPLDFVSEVLVPTEIRDERTVDYQLSPQMVVPRQELLQRAENLRQSTLRGSGLPVPLAAPPQPVPTRQVPPQQTPLQPETLPPFNPADRRPLTLPAPPNSP